MDEETNTTPDTDTSTDASNDTPTEGAAASGTKSVEIFSTPTCGYCKAAKDFFAANNVAYTEYDVAADTDKRQDMIDMTGQMGVPVIKIGDDVVVGFDEGKVKELLGV